MGKGVEYIEADKFSFGSIPKQYIPTERSFYFMGVFLLIGLFISALNIPFGSMISGNSNITMDLGYPMVIFAFSTENPEIMPLNFVGAIVDCLLFLLLGVILDVSISIISIKAKRVFSEEGKAAPVVFKSK